MLVTLSGQGAFSSFSSDSFVGSVLTTLKETHCPNGLKAFWNIKLSQT